MVRFTAVGIVVALALAAAALFSGSSGEPGAQASQQQLFWGNWTCAEDVQDTQNFLQLMNFYADLPSTTGACPGFGEMATDGSETLMWGDADCSEAIEPLDGLLLLLWYEDLGEPVQGCPDLGDLLDAEVPTETPTDAPTDTPEPTEEPTATPVPVEADWIADSSDYEIIGPYGTSAQSNNFGNRATLIRADGFAHNAGPDEANGIIYSEVIVNEGELFIRWIGQAGETCMDISNAPLPCSEGGNNGQQNDTCLDEVDNDGDSATDLDDPGCPEIIKLETGIFQFPNNGGGVYDRYFTLTCENPGIVSFTLHHHVDPAAGVFDPNDQNNDSDVTVTGECFFTKGGRADAQGSSGPRPEPYFPAAFPQTGGPR